MSRLAWAGVRAFALVAIVSGCADTGQTRASIALLLAGTSVEEPISIANGWSVELTRAELAFGPLYLCAGYQAGSLCETARMEWVESDVVDALDPEPHDAGVMNGVTGPVRSWMHDLGITSLLTQQTPKALSAAQALGGNSLRLEGIASKGPHSIPFRFEIPVQQEEATEIGVSVVRKSGSDAFQHDITGEEASLTVRFDPRPWLRDVDFNALVEDAECVAGGPPIVCNGVVELTCSAAGEVDAQRDCASLGLACVQETGCVERLQLKPQSQGYRAVRGALVSGARPAFEWSNTR